jgi:hypothetical protein
MKPRAAAATTACGPFALLGTAGETPPCRHDRHSNITPHHAAMWTQDHDDNHDRTCTTPRQDGVTCKLARFPPSGSRPLGQKNLLLCMWPGPELYIRVTRAPFSWRWSNSRSSHSGSPSPRSSSPTSFTILALLIVRTSEHSSEEHVFDHLWDWT